MIPLPPEYAVVAALIDAQPPPVRTAFRYCLCLMLVETGHLSLIAELPGQEVPLVQFMSGAGETFTISRPPLGAEQEAALLAALREILREEGLL